MKKKENINLFIFLWKGGGKMEKAEREGRVCYLPGDGSGEIFIGFVGSGDLF